MQNPSETQDQATIRKQSDAIAAQSDKIDAQANEITDLQDQIEAAKFDLPMLKLSSQILLVPLVGAMDSVKSQQVMEDVLQNIKAQETRVAVIDIAGIKVMDSSVAAHLVRIAKAATLMGCQSIISGISPAVATNIVNLGADVSGIGTTNTLEDAIERAYTIMGLKLVRA